MADKEIKKDDHILTDRELDELYGKKYAYLSLYPEESKSKVIPMIISMAAACIGVLPGCLIWIKLGSKGVISDITGIIMGFGAYGSGKLSAKLFGYNQVNILQKIACGVVALAAVWLSARYVVVGNVMDILNSSVDTTQQQWVDDYREKGYPEHLIEEYTDKSKVYDFVCEHYGIEDISRSECSKHFSSLIDRFKCKKLYIKYIFTCCLLAYSGIELSFADRRSKKEKVSYGN